MEAQRNGGHADWKAADYIRTTMTELEYEKRRIKNSVDDIVSLKANVYCELGPGEDGLLSRQLSGHGVKSVAVEAPWAQEVNMAWAKELGIRIYLQEFFTGDLSVIEEPVDCFILTHCIAHFRFSPYILMRKLYDALPSGGYMYLTTVNATSYMRVMQFVRGQAISERVPPKENTNFIERAKEWNRTGMQQIWDDWMHVKEYTLPEIKELFTETGFKIVRAHHRNNHPEWNRTFWKKNLAIKFLPHLADEIVVVGRKP